MLLPLNYRRFRGIELYFLAPGQVLDLRSSAWLNTKMLDQIEIGGNVRFSRNKQLYAAMLIWFPYLESRNHVPCFGAR